MNKRYFFTRTNALAVGLIALSSISISGGASALAKPISADSTTNTTALHASITKGDQEISRRLTSLGTLTAKISAATKLSSSDKATLSTEVSSEVTGLTALKTKLDAATTTAEAHTDAQSIYTDYRVYALVVPKVQLVKTADDQQVVETKLTALATKLQTRLTAAQKSGKDMSALQTKLTDLNAKVTAAQSISAAVQTKAVNLQPSDYNSDHALLSGDAAQLKIAHSDDQAATVDAQAIIKGLKTL